MGKVKKRNPTKVSELLHDDRNYNKGNEFGKSLIEKSLKNHGAGRSILLDKNNRIIAGNKTIENASALGLEDIIVVETTGSQIVAVKRMDVDLDTKKGREMALADNASAKANIEWDAELIAEDWTNEEQEEWGIKLDFDEKEAEDDEYDMPEEVKTDIVPGDLFEIGPHRLLCGDSTQTDTFKKLFGEQLADMVVTDPPYNVALGMESKEQAKARNRRTDGKVIQHDKMSNEDFYKFLYDFYTALGSYTKPGGAWYVWHADSEVINFRKAMIDSGIMVKQGLVWEKSRMVMGRQDYQWQHEPCLYGWKEGAAHGWYSDRKQTTILKFDKPSRNGEHPTMKPIPLFAYQIGNSSKEGDIVADGFGGSGTTMVACHQMNRRAYVVEFDPKYVHVIVDRMVKLDPKIVIKKNGKKYVHKAIKTEK